MKRPFARAIALLASIALGTLAAMAQTPEKKQLKLGVGGKPSLYYLTLTLCEQLGYFKEQGLDVEINDFSHIFAGGTVATPIFTNMKFEPHSAASAASRPQSLSERACISGKPFTAKENKKNQIEPPRPQRTPRKTKMPSRETLLPPR